eukprot:8480563-Pyramimonas_sp.AAC.1
MAVISPWRRHALFSMHLHRHAAMYLRTGPRNKRAPVVDRIDDFVVALGSATSPEAHGERGCGALEGVRVREAHARFKAVACLEAHAVHLAVGLD